MATLSWWRVEQREGFYVRATLVAAADQKEVRKLFSGPIHQIVYETICGPAVEPGTRVPWTEGGRLFVDGGRPQLPNYPVRQ